ncbi:hypothetical protein EVC45_01355 [Paraburkholderia sp. UYCP14C]|uniref:hypothetical protein n=1 Tax=Paraburkholderia sp. UYCP14C TaxID=2511130 RepID=UPI0010223A79|nr:hypothetical protein [Paraburkholderia sp. UYCP14C]RZF31738.1 hypothetical protein EVC45_01355 [Paraburkholderia sp. UYCP14C]
MASERRNKVLEQYLEPSVFFNDESRKQFPSAKHLPLEGGPSYQKLRPDMIYSLLSRSDKMHNAANLPNIVSAHALLERMSGSTWTCTATAHEGGLGNATRKPDPYIHFNVNFKRAPKTYHVRCRELEKGGLLVFQVTY